MKESEVRDLQDRAAQGNATLNDVVQIMGATLVSSSKHSKDIKELLAKVVALQNDMVSRIERVERQTLSPVWQMMVEDEADEASEATAD